MEKRDALKIWTIFLAILGFSLSLIGTFLVRSGVLTSVHAFASDPRRGIFILLILVVFIGGALVLFAARAGALRPGGIFAPLSREGALVLNNLLLTTCCATVLIGTLYPLALEALTGAKISVGAPFFNLTFVPLFLPLFLAMPFGQNLAWKRGDMLGAAQRLVVAGLAGVAALLVFAAWHGAPVTSILVAGIAVYAIVGAFADLGRRILAGGLATAAGRLRGLPGSAYGTALAHAGLGVTLLGLAATGWGAETIVSLRPGEPARVGPYELTIDSLVPANGPNYRALVARTTVREAGVAVATIEPASRFYPVRQMSRAEAGILTLGLGQVYMSIGNAPVDGRIDVRLFWKPLVTLIWVGTIVMGLGGAVSLSDRRLRIGVARRAAALPRPQPAE
jgi:cytochrome c-type biogenesis protein CcmF